MTNVPLPTRRGVGSWPRTTKLHDPMRITLPTETPMEPWMRCPFASKLPFVDPRSV
jgi:hypothetical protein